MFFRYCFSWCVLGVLVVGLGCSSPPLTDGNTTLAIGVVDYQRVQRETTAGEQVNEALKRFVEGRQALLELEMRELEDLQRELVTQGSVLSQTARQQREERLRQKGMEFERKRADLNQEVQDKQQELLNAFRTKVKAVVSRVAQEQNLSIVFEQGHSTSTLYHHPAFDISEKVIAELNEEEEE